MEYAIIIMITIAHIIAIIALTFVIIIGLYKHLDKIDYDIGDIDINFFKLVKIHMTTKRKNSFKKEHNNKK